jgi:LmbE family N-acetylglucosaminyl deacetylase
VKRLQPKLLVRRGLSGLARRRLRRLSRPFPLAAATRTLVLSPHQDDETLGCGGIIPQILAAGHQVNVTYITDGGASHPGYPGLAGLRRAEALAATALLGVASDRVEFLDAGDGTLASLKPADSANLVGRLGAILLHFDPTLVLLPCRSDGSAEHDAAHALFLRALAATPLVPRVLEFPVWSWWNPLLLRRTLREPCQVWRTAFPSGAGLKQRALAAHVTQLTVLRPGSGPMLTPAFLSFFAPPEEFFFEHARTRTETAPVSPF